MKITPYINRDKTPTVLCLGWFDSVHRGHKKIIESAKKLCSENGARLCVLTFLNDENFLLQKNGSLVFTFSERVSILQKEGVSEVIYAVFTREFASKPPLDFLNEICDNRLIAGFLCGSDYRFGFMGKGDVELLSEFCSSKNLPLKVCDFERDELGEKISTGKIKQLLACGKIELVNSLLGDRYFITGKVVRGRMQGNKLGFPTANVLLPESKAKLKSGVYSTSAIIDGREYKAVTNVGTAPTFDFDKEVIETHVIDFSGDLYSKEITVYFNGFIRDIVKFESKEQLIKQLEKDVMVVK